jgi:hypothetical protein
MCDVGQRHAASGCARVQTIKSSCANFLERPSPWLSVAPAESRIQRSRHTRPGIRHWPKQRHFHDSECGVAQAVAHARTRAGHDDLANATLKVQPAGRVGQTR